MTDIIKDDEFIDEELQRFGVKFTDATAQSNAPATKNNAPRSVALGQGATATKGKYVTSPKCAPGWYDRLKGCAKWSVAFGALCCLIFYWQQTGLMAPEAAVPSMCACNLFLGLGVGKNMLK